mgnify:CR=1 FL=1
MLSLRQALSLDSIRSVGDKFSKLACIFDGVDAHVIVADSAALRPTSALSISLWAQASNWNLPGTNNKEYIMGCVKTGGWGIRLNNDGSSNTEIQFEIKTASGYIYAEVDTTRTHALSGYVNIIATYSQTTGVSNIYHDNDTTGTTTGNATAGDAISYHSSPAPIFIGADAASATTAADWFDGIIDEVAVFNTVLSSGDRDTIYNGGKPGDLTGMSGLIGWWRMGEDATFPTIPDASSNSNNATMTTMVAGDITSETP